MGWSQEVVSADRAFHVGPLASVSKAGNQIRILEVEYCSKRSDVALNEERLRANMRSTKGGLYSQQVVDGDIGNLYQTGDYSNVQIVTSEMRSDDGERGVRLTILVQPRPCISEVEIKRKRVDGALDNDLSVKREELLGVHPKTSKMGDAQQATQGAERFAQNQSVTKAGETLREERLFRDATAMEELYRKKGYKDVKINPEVVDVGVESAKVVFQVEEGKQGFIEEVRFLGNKEVGEEELKKVVQLKPIRWMDSKEATNCFEIDQFEMDLARLKDLYINKGFLDVQVRGTVHALDSSENQEREKESHIGKGVFGGREDLSLLYRVVEGQRYGVEKISVSGNHLFTEKDILKELRSGSKKIEIFDFNQLKMLQVDGLARGRAFSVNGLQASIETLQSMYGRKGFREVRVEWKTEPSEKKGELDVHFKIVEGEKFQVDKVIICGNTFSKDEVIRREILLASGDVFDTEKEKRSKENILKTGLFSMVETYVEDADRPNYQKLIIKVVEKPKQLTFGIGMSYFWNWNSERSLVLGSYFPFIITLNFSQNWGVVFERLVELIMRK